MSGVAMVPVLYRIVKSNPSTVDDFTSPMMQGKLPRRIEREHPEEWTGLSLFDSPGRAREKAREFSALGGFIATVRLDTRRTITRQTFGLGHYTVWGLPEVILATVYSSRDPVTG